MNISSKIKILLFQKSYLLTDCRIYFLFLSKGKTMAKTNMTFDVEDWNNEYARRYLVSTILQSLFLVVGFSGNLIVIIVYTTKMKSKHDDRYFIPFLASVDLAGCLVSTTLILLSNNQPYKYPNSTVCKSLNVVACGLIVASIFLLLVISVQRYQKICRPFGFQMNIKCKRTVVAIVLLLAAAFAFPTIFLYEKVEVVHPVRNITGHRCGHTEKFGEIYRGIVIGAELMSVICMSFFYGFVGYTLITKMKPTRKEHEKVSESRATNSEFTVDESKTTGTIDDTTDVELRLDKNGGTSNKLEKKNEKTRNAKTRTGKHYSLMFMLISLVSILCFFPPWIFVLLETKNKAFWNHLTYEETQVFIIIRGLFVLNFVVNPFIYGYFDSKFRRNVAKVIFSFCK